MAKYTTSYEASYGETPISSQKWNNAFGEVFDKIHLIRTNYIGTAFPTGDDAEIGQLSYRSDLAKLYICTAVSTYKELAQMDDVFTTASEIPIVDSGGLYTASNVEAALQEIHTKLSSLSTGHIHDGIGSRKISYTNLSNIPSSFNPSNHASSHIGGSDAIQLATDSLNGLMSSVLVSKLNGIESNADVTDADNIKSAMYDTTNKTSVADADIFPLLDSVSAYVLKKVPFNTIKSTLKTYFDTLYQSVNTAILKSIGTAKGDIIGFSASGVPTRVPAGSNGTVLMADSTMAGGVKWYDALSGKTDKATLTTKGDLYVRDATGVTRLPVGSDGEVLMADSSEAEGVVWSPPVDFATTAEVTGVHTTGSITSADDEMTVASATGIVAGMYVVGEGIAPGTTVATVSGTTVTLSENAGRTLSSDSVGFYVADKVLSPGLTAGMLCRAWVNFNGKGTVAIRAAMNVSSITDNGTGDYTINFTTAMPDANYCIASGPVGPGSNADALMSNNTPQQDSVRLQSRTSTGYTQDKERIFVAVFR